uniref:Uncharacterized protein n=1 Tax=Anguilla anguilla TaxID=7936 RepID=A0A0E9UY75_ANGAN
MFSCSKRKWEVLKYLLKNLPAVTVSC